MDSSILLNELVHFQFKGCLVYFFLILLDISVSKQWRPWSDAVFCCVWSGSTLFAYVLDKYGLLLFYNCISSSTNASHFIQTAIKLLFLSLSNALNFLEKKKKKEIKHVLLSLQKLSEPHHDKTNKMVHARPVKTQISLGIRAVWSVWSESSLCAWRKLGSLATHKAHSEDSDQTG